MSSFTLQPMSQLTRLPGSTVVLMPTATRMPSKSASAYFYMPMYILYRQTPPAGAWPERPTVLTFDSAAVPKNTFLSNHFILK